MLARSVAFICATTATCVLLVGGDRIAEYNELFANAGMPDLTTAQMKDFAQEVKDSSTVEEKQILNTLLQERLSWHPEAPDLLTQVVKRGRRLADNHATRMVGCMGMKTRADCLGVKKGNCSRCSWSNRSTGGVWVGSCSAPGCDDYKDSTSCCANARKVDEGCFWQTSDKWTKKDADGRSKRIEKCVAMTCDRIASGLCSSGFGENCAEGKTACMAQKGCTYFDNVRKCVDSNMECFNFASGNTSSPTCFVPCPVDTCARCFSLCLNDDWAKCEWQKELEGKCADKCKGVVQCVEEVACLKRNTADDTCDQKGSCVAELVFPKAATACEATCKAFDKRCQKCSSKTTCGGASKESGGTASVAPFMAPFASAAMSCIAAVLLAVKH